MSKSRGNVIDPWTTHHPRRRRVRWYFFGRIAVDNRRVDVQMIDQSTRRFLVTLWNTYSFFVTYATLDGWSPENPDVGIPAHHVLDRWVRSRLHSTIRDVTDALEGFDALGAAQALEAFVDDLSNWYVRRSRARFWKAATPRHTRRCTTACARFSSSPLCARSSPTTCSSTSIEAAIMNPSRPSRRLARGRWRRSIRCRAGRRGGAAGRHARPGRARRGEAPCPATPAAGAGAAPRRRSVDARGRRGGRRRAEREARRADRRSRRPLRAHGRTELPCRGPRPALCRR